jgi:hypothetical protein
MKYTNTEALIQKIIKEGENLEPTEGFSRDVYVEIHTEKYCSDTFRACLVLDCGSVICSLNHETVEDALYDLLSTIQGYNE